MPSCPFKKLSFLLAIASSVGAAWAAGPEAKPLTVSPVNPAFLAHFRYDRHATTLFGRMIAKPKRSFGWMPSPVDLPPAKGPVFRHARAAGFPAAYDLRSLQQVSPIRNQRPWGSCWLHAALASLESSQLKSGHGGSDLSEWHLGWFAFNWFPGTDPYSPPLAGYSWEPKSGENPYDIGGYDGMAVATLAKGAGAVYETDSPYQRNTPYPASSLPSGWEPTRVKLQQALFVRSKWWDTDPSSPIIDPADVKSALMTYGALSVGIAVDDYMYFEKDVVDGIPGTTYNPATRAYRDVTSAITDTNHAVDIVGWDDNYPASNFHTGGRPSANGAWIVRNSWGTEWGDSGYFYMSYDSHIFDGVAYVNSEKIYDRIYQYDPLGWLRSIGFSSTTASFANVFTAKDDDRITAISLYTTDANTSYAIRVLTDVGADPSTGTLASGFPQSGRFDAPGYRMVDLDHPVSVTRGQKFAIVVTVTNPTSETPIPIEWPDWDMRSDTATANPGESFVSRDGETWTDLVTVTSPIDCTQTNVCLKAFAVTPTVRDLDSDGKTDVKDLAVLSANYGALPQAGDLNGDGVVDDKDIAFWFQGF